MPLTWERLGDTVMKEGIKGGGKGAVEQRKGGGGKGKREGRKEEGVRLATEIFQGRQKGGGRTCSSE